MRATKYTGGLTALLASGGFAAGCGAGKPTPRVVPRPHAPIASILRPAQIAFLAPARGASVGSTVVARVKGSRPGRVRFRLDGGRPRTVAGRAITYRRLAPGRHRLVAQLLAAGEQRAAASATTHFDTRRARTRPVTATPTAPPSPSASTSAAPAPAPASGPSPTAPAAPATRAPAVAPPAPKSSPSPKVPPASSIPQGGGGDGDGDNSGGPSDGDGNI